MSINQSNNCLYTSIETINNITPNIILLLNKMNIYTKIDLLFHFPTNVTVNYYKENLTQVKLHELTTLPVTILSYKEKNNNNYKKLFQVIAEDVNKTQLTINFFNYKNTYYIKKLFPLATRKNITGNFEILRSNIVINHPKVSSSSNVKPKAITTQRIYKTIKGVSNQHLNKLISSILEINYDIPEWLDENFIKTLHLPTFVQALRNIHLNDNFTLDIKDKNLLRLSIDEMLAFHLKLMIAKNNKPKISSYEFHDDRNLIKVLYKNLPFALTSSQIKAIKEIFQDLKSKKQMVRVLEGDVGSGKTIVAMFSAVLAVSSNYTVALMVPTENLAQQHFNTFSEYTAKLGINLALLTGSTKSKERKEIIYNITNKKIDILIGTQAIFHTDVIFNSLGLIIIDEQHRFGVMQRLKLNNKDKKAHVLMLSATPIPRTLALTHYGHIKISQITHKPQNRKPLITKAIDCIKINTILHKIIQKVLDKNKVFWICPLIENNKNLEYTAALDRYNSLLQYLPQNYVWLLHGKLLNKEQIIYEFRNATQGILVSTTVIEVGLDIQDANIMIIEDADRFGLAQLHQLRGRVGRGNLDSYCLLIYNSLNNPVNKKRMQIIEESNDGFYIAEKDFELRGGGNILGTQQSGENPFKIARLEHQNQYMKSILNYATYLYTKQPDKFIEYSKILDKIFRFNSKDFSFIDIFNNG